MAADSTFSSFSSFFSFFLELFLSFLKHGVQNFFSTTLANLFATNLSICSSQFWHFTFFALSARLGLYDVLTPALLSCLRAIQSGRVLLSRSFYLRTSLLTSSSASLFTRTYFVMISVKSTLAVQVYICISFYILYILIKYTLY